MSCIETENETNVETFDEKKTRVPPIIIPETLDNLFPFPSPFPDAARTKSSKSLFVTTPRTPVVTSPDSHTVRNPSKPKRSHRGFKKTKGSFEGSPFEGKDFTAFLRQNENPPYNLHQKHSASVQDIMEYLQEDKDLLPVELDQVVSPAWKSVPASPSETSGIKAYSNASKELQKNGFYVMNYLKGDEDLSPESTHAMSEIITPSESQTKGMSESTLKARTKSKILLNSLKTLVRGPKKEEDNNNEEIVTVQSTSTKHL